MKTFLLLSSVALLSACAAVDPSTSRPGHHAMSAQPGYERQMNSMQDMHRRMMAATSPEERAALKAEHMKAMDGGLSMMCEMDRAGDARDAVRRCMDMKGMAMQMMMDHEAPAKAPASK